MLIKPINKYNRTLTVPGDKSITHRAVMFNALSAGKAAVRGALLGADCISTIECMRALGSVIDIAGDTVTVAGVRALPSARLDVGNSGTTIRLLTGALAGIKGTTATLTGDGSVCRRPMNRVIDPLRAMGADIESQSGGLAPLTVRGGSLKGIDYTMPVASAQVKSAIILAGLNAEGATTVRERVLSRDHTEIMLKSLGADIGVDGKIISIKKSKLTAADITVPGDISSAVFAAALGTVAGRVTIRGVGVNPTRTGCLDILKMAGAHLTVNSISTDGEPVADITIKRDKLKPFVIEGDIIPRLIDEIPALAVLACFCEGTTVIRDAAELAVKESNRIATVTDMINALGGKAAPTADGMIIEGKGYLEGGGIDAKGDHRIAMSGAVALALSRKGGHLSGGDCAAVSYPDFFEQIIL